MGMYGWGCRGVGKGEWRYGVYRFCWRLVSILSPTGCTAALSLNIRACLVRSLAESRVVGSRVLLSCHVFGLRVFVGAYWAHTWTERVRRDGCARECRLEVADKQESDGDDVDYDGHDDDHDIRWEVAGSMAGGRAWHFWGVRLYTLGPQSG